MKRQSRRGTATLALCIAVVMAPGLGLVAPESQRDAAADWPIYNRDLAGTRYSPLDQIDTRTVESLQEQWSYRFHPEPGFVEGPNPSELFQQVTPIVVDGVMYLAAGNRVVALQPETGVNVSAPTSGVPRGNERHVVFRLTDSSERRP